MATYIYECQCVTVSHFSPLNPRFPSHPPPHTHIHTHIHVGKWLVGGVHLPQRAWPHHGQQQLLRHGNVHSSSSILLSLFFPNSISQDQWPKNNCSFIIKYIFVLCSRTFSTWPPLPYSLPGPETLLLPFCCTVGKWTVRNSSLWEHLA